MSFIVLFFKQKTAYEMRISDWSSDVCSSDQALANHHLQRLGGSRLSKTKRRDTLADRCRIARHEQPEIGIEARPEIQSGVAIGFLDSIVECRDQKAQSCSKARTFAHIYKCQLI